MIRQLEDLEYAGKTVLLQMSLDVPLHDGKVSDDTRLRDSIPTIRELLEKNCKIVICGHVGRPKGTPVPELSTKPIAAELEKILEQPVHHLSAAVGEAVRTAIQDADGGNIFMLENLRYYPGAEEPSMEFAKELASLADVFVNDEYPNAHRKHACEVLLPKLLPAAAGRSMVSEYEAVRDALENPKKPFVLIIGGAKKDKIGVVDNMLGIADHIIVGGVLANTFLKASGVNVQGSKCDEQSLEIAGEYLRDAEEKFLLPVDVVAAASFNEDAEHGVFAINEIPEKWLIMDIGPETRKQYTKLLAEAKTVVWGGPIGVYEWEPFSGGTEAVAKAIAESSGYSLVAGGDSGDAVRELGYADRIHHVSIGGGATLTLIAGEELPALEALRT